MQGVARDDVLILVGGGRLLDEFGRQLLLEIGKVIRVQRFAEAGNRRRAAARLSRKLGNRHLHGLLRVGEQILRQRSFFRMRTIQFFLDGDHNAHGIHPSYRKISFAIGRDYE